ncbi:hypothetical protein ABEI18_24445 [Erwinia billingiae]
MIASLQAVFIVTEEDEELYGANLIEFSSDGKITDFMVMMRPAHVVSTLSAAVARHLPISHLP